MDVLILGGSAFLGPHLVDSLRHRGHSVTLLNRGQRSPRPPAGVAQITGDRATDLARLHGRRFDAVVDTCGFVPRVVRLSLEALADATAHYTFVSSISAYADPLGGTRAEDEPLATIADPTVEEITAETYGALKALCEEETRRAMGERALIVRPGLIVGPLDPTDRFTYWPHRFALGGDVLVPGVPEQGTAIIDVRDLADWLVLAIERRTAGTFNASGDASALTMGAIIDACVRATGGGARPVWVDAQFLAEHDVAPWSELPIWLPPGSDSIEWASSAKAVAAGLTYRPIDETVRATLAWTREAGLDRPLKAGLSREREAQLLAAYARRAPLDRA